METARGDGLMKVILLIESERLIEQIRYAFALLMRLTFLEHDLLVYGYHDDLPIEDSDLVIVYGHRLPPVKAEKIIHMAPSGLFSDAFLEMRSLPNLPLKRYKDLPILYCSGDPVEKPYVRRKAGQVSTNMDIVASAFFLITRYEEFLRYNARYQGRVPFEETLEYKERFWDRPLTNEYAALLRSWIDTLIPEKSSEAKLSLWEGRRAAICLTHDVDYYRKAKPLLMTAKLMSEFFRHKRFGRGLTHLSDFFMTILRLKKDSYLAIDELLKMEAGFKSTYYFLSAKTSRWYRSYRLDGEVRDKIKRLKEEGCEIGLHVTPYAYNNFEAMKSEKESLEKVVKQRDYGVRHHELRWDPHNSWQIQDSAGFQYDSTLTFPEKGGFRCGICHPFQPFDLRNGKRLDIWEIPITLMDATLRDPKYLSMEPEEAYEEMLRYLLIIEKYHGVFVLLWHNTSFDEVDWKGWREIYDRFVAHISEREYWVDLCRNLLRSYCGVVAPHMKKEEKRR